MTTRIEQMESAVDGGRAGVLVWRHELLDSDGVVLATSDREGAGDAIVWGAELQPIQLQANRVSPRTSTLRVVADTLDLVPDSTDGILHPDSGNRVRTSAGVRTGQGTTWWTQSTMLPERVEARSDGGAVTITVTLAETLSDVRSDFTTGFAWSDGETLEAIVSRALLDVAPEATIPTTGYSALGGDAAVQESRYDLVNNLLESAGYELISNPEGLVQARQILPSDDDPAAQAWTYGPDGFAIDQALRTWRARVPRGVRIEGGADDGASPVQTTVFDLDPASQGYFSGLGQPVSLLNSRWPYASDLRQLQVGGYGQLRRYGLGPDVITFQTIPNPAMRQGDLVNLRDDSIGVDGRYRVLGFSLPVQVDGPMTVQARKVWEPDLGYLTPGVGIDPTCLVSWADPFDREDQDLQVIDGSGEEGSTAWTEIGYSWAVVGRQAIQRYNNGWSLAFVNQPLCASNQYAEVTIQRIPSGRRVGPVCRCDGTFSGYAALMDSHGRTTLEMWLNNRSVKTLGSYQHNGTLPGRELRVSADGTTITAHIDGAVVITADNSALTGLHPGILGYGGTGSNAPAVQPFAAGPV